MPMKIDHKSNFSLLADILQKRFNRNNLRAIWIFLSCIPSSIQIFPHQIRSIMTKDNTIRVNHGNYIKYIVFQKKFRLFCLLNKPINNAFTDIRTLSLARMLPSHYYYCFSIISFFIDVLAYHESLYWPFRYCLSNY